MDLCPSNPPIVFKDCTEECAKRCKGDEKINKVDIEIIQ
jgi:hypothetical protein